MARKTVGNREHCPKNGREQGTLASRNREQRTGNVREQGTLDKALPGTGNIGSNVPGNREHGTPYQSLIFESKSRVRFQS